MTGNVAVTGAGPQSVASVICRHQSLRRSCSGRRAPCRRGRRKCGPLSQVHESTPVVQVRRGRPGQALPSWSGQGGLVWFLGSHDMRWSTYPLHTRHVASVLWDGERGRRRLCSAEEETIRISLASSPATASCKERRETSVEVQSKGRACQGSTWRPSLTLTPLPLASQTRLAQGPARALAG